LKRLNMICPFFDEAFKIIRVRAAVEALDVNRNLV